MMNNNDIFAAMHDKMTPEPEVIERLFERAAAEIQSENSDNDPPVIGNGGIIMNKRDNIEPTENKSELSDISHKGKIVAAAVAVIALGAWAAVLFGGGIKTSPAAETEDSSETVTQTTVSTAAPEEVIVPSSGQNKEYMNEYIAYKKVLEASGRSEEQVAAVSSTLEKFEAHDVFEDAYNDCYIVNIVTKSGEQYNYSVTLDGKQVSPISYRINGEEAPYFWVNPAQEQIFRESHIDEENVLAAGLTPSEQIYCPEELTIGGYKFDVKTKYHAYEGFISYDGTLFDVRQTDALFLDDVSELTVSWTENEPYSYSIDEPDTVKAIAGKLREIEEVKNSYLFTGSYVPHGGSDGYIIKTDGDNYEAMYFIEHIEREPNVTIQGYEYSLPDETIAELDALIAPTVPEGHTLPCRQSEKSDTSETEPTTVITAEHGVQMNGTLETWQIRDEDSVRTITDIVDRIENDENKAPQPMIAAGGGLMLAFKHNDHFYRVQPQWNEPTIEFPDAFSSLYIEKDHSDKASYYCDSESAKTIIGEATKWIDIAFDSDRAIEIALADCGITLEDVKAEEVEGQTVHKVGAELIEDDGEQPYYIVKFNYIEPTVNEDISTEYVCEYRINAATGQIIDKDVVGYV